MKKQLLLDRRFDAVHIFRGFLAVGIVWHHCHPPELLGNVPINIPGRILVWLFFVLSGFVLSLGFFEGRYTFDAASIRRFYLRRALRILPLLYCVYFVLLILNGIEIGPQWQETLKNLLFLRYSFHQFPVIGAAWFLGPLIQLYFFGPLIFYVLMKLGIKEKPQRFLIRLTVFSVILHFAGYELNQILGFNDGKGFVAAFDNRTTLGNLGPFLIGALVAPLMQSKLPMFSEDRLVRRNAFCAIGVTMTVSVSYYVLAKYFWVLPSVTIISLCGLFILIWCQKSTQIQQSVNKVNGWLGKTFMMLGTLSYGLFLWHDFLIQKLNQAFPFYTNHYGYFIFAFFGVVLITGIFSLLTFYFIEEPCSRLMGAHKR